MKRCKKCGIEKPRSEFYRASGTRDGLRGDCKSCNLALQHERYMANPAVAKARVKQWQQENADRLNAYRRRRRQDPIVKEREWVTYLRRKYGLSIAEYSALLAVQSGLCAICENPPADGRRLHVDHDHETGRVRGLLCFTCNNALGDFEDDPGRLRSAIGYLHRHDDLESLIRRRIDGLKAMTPAWERA